MEDGPRAGREARARRFRHDRERSPNRSRREQKRLATDSETARIFLPGGAPPVPGTLFQQPELARTLEAIRDRGEDGFYRGRVAQASIEDGQKRAGGLDHARRSRAATRRRSARPSASVPGADVFTTPAPSSGPVLAEMALMAEIASAPTESARAGPEAAHWIAEIEKRAFRDRNRWLGDPAFAGVNQKPVHGSRAARGARRHDRPDIARRRPRTSRVFPARRRRRRTSRSSTARGWRSRVTTTLNDSFGNARVAPGLGFIWNNEMDDFATRPGEPNMYGLIQGEDNAVAPGKRMLSAMCPSIAVVSGRVVLVWGTPGGSTIPTTNLQVLLDRLSARETLEAAVAAPRFHQQDFPDAIQIERGRFDAAWIAALEKMGHAIR